MIRRMADDARSIDIRDFPEFASLAEEVCATNEPRTLRRGDEPIAEIVPVGDSADPRATLQEEERRRDRPIPGYGGRLVGRRCRRISQG
jgi:hypothetical protein